MTMVKISSALTAAVMLVAVRAGAQAPPPVSPAGATGVAPAPDQVVAPASPSAASASAPAPAPPSQVFAPPPTAAEVAAPPPPPAAGWIEPLPAVPFSPPEDETWTPRFYGFVEFDAMHDTTQSYGAASNNAPIARPGSYAAAHARTQFTANNSLLGVRIAAPVLHGVTSSGQAEVDFFGVPQTDATEQTVFATPSVRMRLFYLRLETPVFDLLAGQYHDLFGWGGEGFYQNSLAFLGVAGELYHRNPQIRLSRTMRGDAVQVSVAVAAVRPVQRDGEMPDVQGGVKLAFGRWTGATAQGFGQPAVLPAAIGLSGIGRRFAVAEFLTMPGDAKIKYGWGVAANAFIPVIPASSATDRGNALSFTGEVSMGSGISDLYTGLTGGALFPLLPDPTGNMTPPPIYRQNIDSGIVTFDGNGNLKTIDWRAFVVGWQYYLPVQSGRFWISTTLSHLRSGNLVALTPEAARGGVFFRQTYLDGNIFMAVTPATQAGLSYQVAQQTYGDLPFSGSHPTGRNHRLQVGLRLFF